METVTEDDSGPAQTILFRPSKKRKIYRQRAQDDDNENNAAALTTPSASLPAHSSSADHVSKSPPLLGVGDGVSELTGTGGDVELEGATVPMSEILRLRKLHKQRVGGVEFRPVVTAGLRNESSSSSMALVPMGESEGGRAEEGQAQVAGGVRQFTRQTGLVGDVVDKHM